MSRQGAQRLYPSEVAKLYNQRAGSIEIDYKGDKGGVFVNHLRTRSFCGAWSFLITAFLTANLLSLFRAEHLAGTALESLGTVGMIHNLFSMPGRISIQGKMVDIAVPSGHPLGDALVRSGCG